MKTIALILALLPAIAPARNVKTCFVTNCADISRILRDGTNAHTRFEITVRALSDIGEFGKGMIVADASGATILGEGEALDEKPLLGNGDVFTVSGRICTPSISGPFTRAEKIFRRGRGKPYVPPTLSIDEFVRNHHDNRPIRMCGIVRDLIFDEIDPGFAFIVLNGSNTVAYAACRYPPGCRRSALKLIGAEVAVTGVREIFPPTNRRQAGRNWMSYRNRVEVLRPPPSDPFDVPPLGNLVHLGPLEVARLGPHGTRGAVLAVWESVHLLILREDGEPIRVELAEGPAPEPGSSVEIAGYPAADPYHVNLVRARWRNARGPVPPETPPEDVRSADILRSAQGDRIVIPAYYGKVLRVTGTLIDRTGDSRIVLHDGTGLVSVDIGACGGSSADWQIGSVVSATGICIMDISAWQPHATFPQIKGFFLVTRRPDDLRLLASPPWWTPRRTWTVLCGLTALLFGVLLWNVSLRHLAERRGRELLRGQIESVKSRLQVEERTRLAVELHDSLSQTLTGVSMEIAAAENLKENPSEKMFVHLARAGRTLKSCRDELRNCLWDLRSDALDDSDITRAILRTLQPHIDEKMLTVRFNVPRTRISDNTVHALLRMIRELVINAVRHGRATSVKVAGNLDGGSLNFSVRDNGCGFDPDRRPGVADGHFGLEGVQERLNLLGGSMTVSSSPGRGSRISGSIPVHSPSRAGV